MKNRTLHSNDTWKLVELQRGKKAIPNRWCIKSSSWIKKLKYKARLVVEGYVQVNGVDIQEVFSHLIFTTF